MDKNGIIEVYDRIVARYGGSLGIRDIGQLENAATTPFLSFGGVELFPTVELKAAALTFYITKDHCFIDGNKRTAIATMQAYLELEGVLLDYSQDELVDLALDIANGRLAIQQIAEWIKIHERR